MMPQILLTLVIRLLNDSALQVRLATNARRLAETKYDWRITLTGLDEVYPQLPGIRV